MFERAQHAAEILDEYDFTGLLETATSGCELKAVVGMLGARYGKQVALAFDDLSTQEIITYLRERYHVLIDEVVRYDVYWNSMSKRDLEFEDETKN